MPRPDEELCDILDHLLSIDNSGCKSEDKFQVNKISQLTNFPQIWVESVCEEFSGDEDDVATSSRLTSFSSSDVSFETASLSSQLSSRQNSLQGISRENSVERCTSSSLMSTLMSTTSDEDEIKFTEDIKRWIERREAAGFPIELLRSYSEESEELSEEDDDTWWEDGLVRVFDPYCEISKSDIKSVDGKTNSQGSPVGVCIVKLKNGDVLSGTFRNGSRKGRGSIESVSHGIDLIRGFYKDGVLSGEGRAIIAPGAWTGVSKVTLEGVFSNGYLEGPVKGVDDKGNLVFLGAYKDGLPSGPCWLGKEGQSWIHGVVDHRGRFSGDNIMFVYPDLHTCILGSFDNEQFVSGRPTVVQNAYLDSNGIMVLTPVPPVEGSPVLTYSPSNKDRITCDWNIPEPYESRTVFCKTSKIDGAGDGLFARRDLPANLIVSYYNGLHIKPGEAYKTNSYNYQIYVDWKNTDNSPFVDIPSECSEVTSYQASLAHKANHSFLPNCQFIAVDHPRFGRIPALKTLKPIKKGEELFSHYKYDMALAPSWYQEAWNQLYEPEFEPGSGQDCVN